jgi:hypothetical protein
VAIAFLFKFLFRLLSVESNTSGDDSNIRPPTELQMKILQKHGVLEQHQLKSVKSPSGAVDTSDFPQAPSSKSDQWQNQGHHSLRSKLQLNGLQVTQPLADSAAAGVPLSADSWDYIGTLYMK